MAIGTPDESDAKQQLLPVKKKNKLNRNKTKVASKGVSQAEGEMDEDNHSKTILNLTHCTNTTIRFIRFEPNKSY